LVVGGLVVDGPTPPGGPVEWPEEHAAATSNEVMRTPNKVGARW